MRWENHHLALVTSVMVAATVSTMKQCKAPGPLWYCGRNAKKKLSLKLVSLFSARSQMTSLLRRKFRKTGRRVTSLTSLKARVMPLIETTNKGLKLTDHC